MSDSNISELQVMIADSVGRLFAEQVTTSLRRDFDQGGPSSITTLWPLCSELGLDLALAPTDAGGSGATWLEAYPVFRGLGYWQAPLPLAETMLASLLLARAALAHPGTALTVIEASRQAEGLRLADGRLHGTASTVPWARHCDHAVIAMHGKLLLVDLRQAGAIQIDALDNLAAEPSDTVHFNHAVVLASAALPFASLGEPVWVFGALMRSAMMVGALECVLDEAVNHANTRVQFGKPLGKFQAIQQSLAAIAGAIGAARVATQVAFAAAPVGNEASDTLAFDIAVAKVRTGEAATQAAAAAHQVLGAIGFTQEHTLHFATRRLWSWRAEFGSDASWAEALGKAAIAAGTKGFWPALTARHF